MDPQLIAFLEERFRESRQHFEARLDRLEETVRQTLELVGALRNETHLVAEALVGLDARLERAHRENTAMYEQVRGWIRPTLNGMDGRVKILEGRSDDRHMDVLDAVRKMLARDPAPPPVVSE